MAKGDKFEVVCVESRFGLTVGATYTFRSKGGNPEWGGVFDGKRQVCSAFLSGFTKC